MVRFDHGPRAELESHVLRKGACDCLSVDGLNAARQSIQPFYLREQAENDWFLT